MDHSLIRLPLSENFSAQYTRLTHFTHTPAQTQHRNHSLPHSLIYTEFLPYNYNDASPGAHPRAQRSAHTENPYKATHPGAAAAPNQGSCAGSYFWGQISRRSSDYCFLNGGGGGEGRGGGGGELRKSSGRSDHSQPHAQYGRDLRSRAPAVANVVWDTPRPLFPAPDRSLYLATRNRSSGRREHIFPV